VRDKQDNTVNYVSSFGNNKLIFLTDITVLFRVETFPSAFHPMLHDYYCLYSLSWESNPTTVMMNRIENFFFRCISLNNHHFEKILQF